MSRLSFSVASSLSPPAEPQMDHRASRTPQQADQKAMAMGAASGCGATGSWQACHGESRQRVRHEYSRAGRPRKKRSTHRRRPGGNREGAVRPQIARQPNMGRVRGESDASVSKTNSYGMALRGLTAKMASSGGTKAVLRRGFGMSRDDTRFFAHRRADETAIDRRVEPAAYAQHRARQMPEQLLARLNNRRAESGGAMGQLGVARHPVVLVPNGVHIGCILPRANALR